MKERNSLSDRLVVGFALFSIFFGAGNLIFPPYLGHLAGSNWVSAMFGFLLTDPVLPVLGVIATIYIGGRADDMGKRVHPAFAKILGALAIIIIGPVFAVPRTSATTFDIGIKPFFPGLPLWIFSLVFFLITWLLVINESGVVDVIGKFLTPALLVVLFLIIITAVFNPPGKAAEIPDNQFFLFGFKEGFQTMDALGAPLMAGIVLTDLIKKGYRKRHEQIPVSIGAALVSFVLLALVYGGLTYVGSTVSSVIPAGGERVELLLDTVSRLSGTFGSVSLSIAISLACMTTSVGLVATFGNFFHRISGGKLPYKALVTGAVIVSYIISLLGLKMIINVAFPILTVLYPLYAILILLSLGDRIIKYDLTYLGGVLGALMVSLPEGIKLIFKSINGTEPFKGFLSMIPLSSQGFSWFITGVSGALLFTLVAMAMGDRARTRDDHPALPDEITEF